jgi:hypothetical protein
MKRSIYLIALLPTIVFGAIITQQNSANADVCADNNIATQCNSLISITNSGAKITPTGAPPIGDPTQQFAYHALIGVENNSSLPINQIAIDGIRPDGYTSNGVFIPGGGYSTSLIFSGSLDPGKSSWFGAFDNNIAVGSSISRGAACSGAINNTLAFSVTDNGTRLNSYFTPNGYSLKGAATACGFIDFNWQQTITFDNIGQLNASNAPNTPLVAPYNDPPPSGYATESSKIKDSYPYYFSLKPDPTKSDSFYYLGNHKTTDQLEFSDQPKSHYIAASQHYDFTT